MSSPRRLRIAYVLDTYDGVKTGGSISAKRFVSALRERHDVTVVSGGASGEGQVGLPQFTIPPFGGVMRKMGFVFAWPSRAALEPVLRRADVVHVQFPFVLGVRAASLARRVGTPVVAASHLLPENMLHNVGIRSEWLADRTWRLFISTLYGRADHLVCPTAFGLDELRQRGLTVPADVISNGIPPQFHAGPAEREERYRGKFLALSVARLAAEKRIDVTIDAIRRSKHAAKIQLVVCGHGPLETQLKRQAAALPVPADFRVVEERDMPALMRSADLLVHSAEVELEGMAVLEALGSGLPALVATARKSAAWELAVGDELRYPAGDAAELARRIDYLIDRPERLAAAREASLEAAAKLTLAASVARLEQVYQRVARPVRSVAPAGQGEPAMFDGAIGPAT